MRCHVFVLLLLGTAAAAAQNPKAPAKRAVLQRTDVAQSPAQETIVGTVEVAPGHGNPFHTHFGSEIGYVVQGHIRLEVKGQAPRELGPGDSFLVTRGQVHRSIPEGNQIVKLVNTWTVDKGKPLLTPVPNQ